MDYWVRGSRSRSQNAGIGGHSSVPCFPILLHDSASSCSRKKAGQQSDEIPAVLVLTDPGLWITRESMNAEGAVIPSKSHQPPASSRAQPRYQGTSGKAVERSSPGYDRRCGWLSRPRVKQRSQKLLSFIKKPLQAENCDVCVLFIYVRCF